MFITFLLLARSRGMNTPKLGAAFHFEKQTDDITLRVRRSARGGELNVNVYLLERNIQMCISQSEDTS